MDYDDNDFQGQNLHLAGEGSSKFSPVLSPYALPKFDFDDSLQGHLRFDSLVENEVFLGIPSQEDNQWIEDFSRGNSGIEFSSSVAESCSITRRNNVWSEATSSESVEMLLKSVGQEEMVPEETIIEESDACDELGSLTRQMEPNPKPDDGVKDVIDLHAAIPPEEFLEDFSGLNGGSGGVRPHVEGTSQTQEAELSAYGSSSELEPSAIGEKCGSFVNEKNQAADTKCDDANKAEADATVNESLNDKTQEDLPLCGMKIDYSTSQDCVASIGELYDQGIPHDVSEMSFENAEGLLKDDGKKAEQHHVESKDDSMNVQNLKGTAVETGSKLEPVEAHAVETSVNNFEVPLPLPLERDADLQIAEYCEDVISTNPSLGRECGDVVLSQSTVMNQQPKADMREATVIVQGEDNFEGRAADISSVDEKECFIGSDSQLVSEASVHNSEASLLSGVDNELSNDVGDGSSNNHEGDLSNLTVACSSTELLAEEPATDNSDVIDDTSQIVKEGSNAEKSILPPMLAGSLQISEEVVTKQSNRHGDQEVSLSEKGKEELPTDHSNMDCETVGSLNKDNVVESSSLDEGSKGNDIKLQKSEFDTASMNDSALDVPLENMNIGSHNALDGVPLPSETGAIVGGVTDHGEEQKSPSPVVGLMDLDKTEPDKVEVPTEVSILTLKECMDVASEVGPLAGLEKGSGDSAGHLPQETTDQSLPVVKLCNTPSTSEQAVVPNEVNQEDSEELEDCPACDSTVKEDDNAEAVVLENYEEATREGNHKVAPSEIAESCNIVGKVHEGNDAIIVSTVDDCERMSSKVEGGGSFTDSDKPTSGSSIVTSCTVLSQSEKDWNEGVNESPEKSVPVSETSDGIVNNVQSTPQDQRRNDASKEGRSFTFEVSPLAAPPERETSKDWQAFPTIQACKISTIVEGSPASCKGQKGPKTVPETARGRPQTHDGENSHGISKGTPERKTRRMSGKATGKENAKKGNHVKESPLARLSEKGDKLSSAPTGPSETGKLVQFDGMKPYGNVESATTKPCGVISIPASNLPDLNSSTPPSALFQQPFTDLQQVQLRAQIFVYGSLIQGTAPEEACMLSAFGTSDGGRNVWEPAWRACVERIQGQKSHPSNSDTPVQSRSGARASDHAIKQGAMQSKVLPSPLGRASSKGTPSPVVHPMIPLSSPLWNISTGLQSSGIARGTILDYHQPLSPLHPYQTPPTQNFVGHNTSWLSQSPFPGAWVASPQTSAFDANARFSVLPITEAVKLTPVKESSLPISSGTKHASSGPVVHGVVPSVFAGTSSLPDMKKVPGSSAQHSADPKSKKRKKVPISEDLGQISLIVQPQTESLSSPVVTSHPSIPVAATTPASFASKSNADKIVKAVTLKSSTDKPKGVDQIAEPKVLISEEIFSKVEEAKLQAEDAAAHAAAAVGHSQDVWSQLDKQKNSRLISDVEANLSSAAAAIAAAAAVARAAAAAAKIASNAALQAKLMADEALFSSGTGNPTQSSAISPSDVVNNLGNATPAAILKGGDGSSSSSSIIIAVREAARRRLEAASAASKHAENLDAIVKAAELAAEAVSQAGKIVAMTDPFPLRELVEAGPDGYWKIPQQPSEQGVKSKKLNKEQSNIERIEEGSNISAKQVKRGPLNDEMRATNHGLPPLSRQFSRDSMEDRMRVGDGISDSVTSGEKNLRGQRGRRASDLSKTIGVVPESEIGTISTSFTVQNEYEKALENLKDNSIKEGCLVEVFKDGGDIKAAWFSASVLNLKDGKAFVCYTELQSDEGKLKEWVALEDEGNKAPRIRAAHPMTSVGFDGTRKRRRAAMGDYAWSVGDKVDAWVQDCWREGVVMEKNMKDETTLTIRFPAEGETSVVRAWHLRPTLIWKDGEWIEWSSAREKGCSSQGDTPQEKRLKLGSPAVGGEEKDKMPTNIDTVESMKPEESHLLPLTAHEKIFNVGKHSRDENKPDALRTMRSGLQKEGSKVIFGVPKPGKKRKFMEVSKHYVAERSTKNIESSDSVKFAKYLMPQGSVSRGWKNNSKIDSKQKQAAESKPKVQKSGRPQGVSGRSRTVAQKDKVLTPVVSSQGDGTIMDHTVKDSMSNDENQSGEQSLREFGSFSNTEGGAEGPILFSSVDIQSNDPKKVSTSNAKSEQLNKGKLAPSGGRFAKVDVKDKVYNGNMGKSIPEIVEPRRSNRRIQPTSRLLEGLQSSLIISKIPSASHDKSHRSTNRGTSKRE